MTHIVVIGGGQAGSSLVAKLRALKHDGPITLICGEDVPPYQRPPLSKAYLLGEMEEDRLYLRPESFYAEKDIALKLGRKVTAVDTAAKTVTVGDEVISYDQLALTTGSVPRRLPEALGGALEGVYTVRSLRDVDAMQPEFQPGRHVLVIGGGYIGLEAAAVASKLGLKVTLVEMAERILQRVAAPQTSDWFRALHDSHGVKIMEKTGIQRLIGNDQGRVIEAELGDGTHMAVDFVIVGVGILPDTPLAEAAGLTVDNGIVLDEQGRTSDPFVWAAGDCARFPFRGQMLRLESVQNAIDQAECVAENMLGAGKTYEPEPWFWSDQYDCHLQIAGLNLGYDRIVQRGEGHSTSFWYYQGDTLLAVDAMNDPRAYMIGKRLLGMKKSPDPAVVADADSDLKALLKA